MHEQLGTLGFVLSLTLVLLGAFFRYTLIRQDAERDRRFRALEADAELLKRASHAAEVSVIRVEGQLAVLRSEHEATAHVLAGIRTDMLGRREFEARMNGVDAAFSAVREQLQGLIEAIARDEIVPSKLTVRPK
jgi:predicted  nucleic acid-binding Zn-ribbon protein